MFRIARQLGSTPLPGHTQSTMHAFALTGNMKPRLNAALA